MGSQYRQQQATNRRKVMVCCLSQVCMGFLLMASSLYRTYPSCYTYSVRAFEMCSYKWYTKAWQSIFCASKYVDFLSINGEKSLSVPMLHDMYTKIVITHKKSKIVAFVCPLFGVCLVVVRISTSSL